MTRNYVYILALVIATTPALSVDLVCQILQAHNYPCERYMIQTSDGYKLALHRIPPKNSTLASNKQPFLLMHGLVGSAADFILAGRKRALGCLLHDQGYDVWLGNARGTTHSKQHIKWHNSERAFWNFSWHEIGLYDLAAIIDFIRMHTKYKRVHYVAHSQGSSVLFVLLAERPVYNKYIISATLLAPVAFLANIKSPPVQFLAKDINKVEALLNHLGLEEILPSTAVNQLGGHLLCGKQSATQNLCLMLTFMCVGYSEFPMDRELFPRIFETTPAGISRKQLLHYGQLIKTGSFQKFDFGSTKLNQYYYQRDKPPSYNLNNIRIPMKLYYGTRDFILDKKDALLLSRKLNSSLHTLHELPGFNHIDLLYSTEAPRMIYKSIIKDVNRYYSR